MNDVSNLLQQVKRALKYYLEMCIADRQEAWGRITRLMSYVSEGGEKQSIKLPMQLETYMYNNATVKGKTT